MEIEFDGTVTIEEAIKAHQGGKYLEDEVVFVSPSVAMKSGAGWYVGSWCLTCYEPGVLYPEPYDRASHYMTKEEAVSLASYYRG